MICRDCELWEKREIPKRKNQFYPAGRCTLLDFNKNGKSMFTSEFTNCKSGVKKDVE